MSLTFEKDIFLEPATDEVVVWATDDAGRFRLTVSRKYRDDAYRTQAHKAATQIVRDNMADFIRLAEAARARGESELAL